MQPINKKDLHFAQIAVVIAIILQLTISADLQAGPRYFIPLLEVLLVFIVTITAPLRHSRTPALHKLISLMLIGIISFANATQLILITNALLHGSGVHGKDLLISAAAIFITNIIMFSLWYWELDSPGLSGQHNPNKQDDFLFTQQTNPKYKNWQPAYADYLYLSVTNSTAFSPTDTLPLTHSAKLLMSAQALISLLTIVLVTARAVNILG